MNHSNTIEQFFALIRSGLWGGKAASSPFDGGADWEALLRLASMQSLTGIFADGAGAAEFNGYYDNTDIYDKLAGMLGVE